jgi:signal transduction histidine kinase
MPKKIATHSPYIGQRPYERKEHHLFFGREAETAQVAPLLERGFILIGPARCGKSSFVNAALVPLLEEAGIEVLPVARMNPDNVNGAQPANIFTYCALLGGLVRPTRDGSRKAAVMTLPDIVATLPDRPRALIFDQADTLFSRYPHRWRDRDQFFEQVQAAQATHPSLRVIFVLREDALANMADYTGMLGVTAHFRLRGLRPEAAYRAITEPLKRTGRTYTADSAELMVHKLLEIPVERHDGSVEVGEAEFVEPEALQMACERLWGGLSADERHITPAHVAAVFPHRPRAHSYTIHDLAIENRRLASEIDTLKAQFDELRRATDEVALLKNAIIRNVSHELKTPLLHVKSAVSLLAEEKINATLADYAMGATARLEASVNNIVQLAYGMNINIEPMLLRESVDLAMRNLRRSWETKDKIDRVQLQVEEQLPPVLADKQGMGIVLHQLTENALKFSSDPVFVRARREGDCVVVSVVDTGIGIARDQIEKIFDAFYQVNSSSTRQTGGMGIGLAIVKLILDRHHVQIQVETEVGRGSTFWFTLPITDMPHL